MKISTKITKVILSLFIITSAIVTPPLANAFLEGWESSPTGTYLPSASLPLIQGDEGTWILGDTVSEFPECGSTPHTAEIILSGGNRSLRLTSNDSSSDCADNVWVNIVEVPQANLNPGFSIPLIPDTVISFEEVGNLVSPETGSPYCVSPPCGDTISLTLQDTHGNMLAYVIQRAPGAVPNEVHSFYREIFLYPNAGAYSRDLFADFNTIPDFNPTGAVIGMVAFNLDEHGTATIDNICIGTSGCVVSHPLVVVPDIVGLVRSEAEAAIIATNLSVGAVTEQTSSTVPGGSVISQAPAAGIEVAIGTEVDLVVSKTNGIYMGDVNSDGFVNLADAILALKVVAGMDSGQVIYEAADVNGDGVIGLAEAIYVLQSLAGLRPNLDVDNDGDGYTENQGDCNDANKNVHPGAVELCNEIDDDCDDQTDEGVQTSYYQDLDGDGYGNINISTQACSPPSGYVTDSSDCNDDDRNINPAATEICGDDIDQNCDNYDPPCQNTCISVPEGTWEFEWLYGTTTVLGFTGNLNQSGCNISYDYGLFAGPISGRHWQGTNDTEKFEFEGDFIGTPATRFEGTWRLTDGSGYTGDMIGYKD